MPKLSMGTGSRVLMCHGRPPLCRGPHDSANDNLELKLRPVGLPQPCGVRDFLHLLRDDLGVLAVQLDALEGEGPRGMGARREGAVLTICTGEQHDEIVKFAVDAGASPAFYLDDFTQEPAHHVQEVHRGFIEKTAGEARISYPGRIL